MPVELPPFKTEWVELVPLQPPDYQFLYQLSVKPEHAYRWRFRSNLPSYEEFVHLLHQGVYVQYLIVGRNGERLGLVVCYRADLKNRHAYIAVQATPECIGRGWVLQAASLFINYLFTCHDFDKLYAEHYEFVVDAFRSGLNRYFVEEACFKGHERFMNRTWDLHIFAYYRSTWMERASRGQIGLGRTVFPLPQEGLDVEDFMAYLEDELELIPGSLRTDATLQDLGFDSIRMTELLVAIEDLGVHLPDEALAEIRTVDDAHFYYLQSQVPKASSAI